MATPDKDEIRRKIDDIDRKLEQQLENVSGMRGAQEDAVRMFVPPLRDLLSLIREVNENSPEY